MINDLVEAALKEQTHPCVIAAQDAVAAEAGGNLVTQIPPAKANHPFLRSRPPSRLGDHFKASVKKRFLQLCRIDDFNKPLLVFTDSQSTVETELGQQRTSKYIVV